MIDISEFELEGNELVDYSGNDEEIIIPEDLGITEIGDWVFADCDAKRIVIPASVTSLGSAFEGCEALMELEVAEGNSKYHSAGNCIIETESKTLVAGCAGSVIPNDGSVTVIGISAFASRRTLENIGIPPAVTEIGDYAFENCHRLKNLYLPASVLKIGECAFKECVALESIDVEEDNPVYKSAGNCLIERETGTLLRGCNASVIPKDGSVLKLGGSSFSGCEIKEVEIPSSVTEIGDRAFLWCSELINITFSENLEHIGEHALHGCGLLREVILPATLKRVDAMAFKACGLLEKVTFLGSEEEWNAIEFGSENDCLLKAQVEFKD